MQTSSSIRRRITQLFTFSSAVIALVALTGCATNGHVVAIGTGTSLGVDVSQDVSGLYHAKLGYHRGELLFVPTTNEYCPDVLAEIQFKGIFSKEGGIYQRVAVGPTAVKQPGAMAMFAKDSSGNLSTDVLNAATPADPNKADLARAYLRSDDRTKWDQAATNLGYASFSAFLGTNGVDTTAMKAELEKLGVL